MAATRTPRRRVPDKTIADPVIFLPAPQEQSHLPLLRVDDQEQAQVAPNVVVGADKRRRELRAAHQARSTLAGLVGREAPPAPADPAPRRGLRSYSQQLKHVRIHRRLLAHGAVLLLALIMAAGGGFPLYPAPQTATDVATVVVEEPFSDPARVVIPISATKPSVGGIDREERYEPIAPPLVQPAPARGPAFVATHVVQADETIASIAAQYNISPDSLIAANDLGDLLAIGERLRIPRMSGVPHVVAEGETLGEIATRYGVAPEEIMTYPPNGLDHGQPLVAGREIFVPNASLAGIGALSARGVADLAQQPASAAAIVRDDRTNLREGPGTNYDKITKLNSGAKLELLARHEEWAKVRVDDGTVAWISREVVLIPDAVWDGLNETDDFPPPPPPPPVWVWPTWGDLTSGFGYRNFSVVAVSLKKKIANRQGTPIVAARSGRVIQAGWCSGYGYCVKISHGDAIVTEYGHMMSQPVVSVGQSVDAGDLIGYMGSTYDRAGGGYSTGPHLHFTVKIDGVAVNPLRYLD